MRIMGIDPGTNILGYGIIDENESGLFPVVYGVIVVATKEKIEDKLFTIYKALKNIIRQYKPEVVAVEEPFVALNVRSALSIGRAQAIAMLTATENKLPIFRYSPRHVKLQVTNYGGSLKNQVNEMVKLQLNLRHDNIEDDASDALAVALCHISQMHFKDLMSKNKGQ